MEDTLKPFVSTFDSNSGIKETELDLQETLTVPTEQSKTAERQMGAECSKDQLEDDAEHKFGPPKQVTQETALPDSQNSELVLLNRPGSKIPIQDEDPGCSFLVPW